MKKLVKFIFKLLLILIIGFVGVFLARGIGIIYSLQKQNPLMR